MAVRLVLFLSLYSDWTTSWKTGIWIPVWQKSSLLQKVKTGCA